MYIYTPQEIFEKSLARQERLVWLQSIRTSVCMHKKENRVLNNKYHAVARKAILGLQLESKYTKLFGCSCQELREHFKSLFTTGMAWSTYAGETGWRIDHVVPKVHFDCTIPLERKECWHYTNLQPLWIEDNKNKRADLTWETRNNKVKTDLASGGFRLCHV